MGENILNDMMKCISKDAGLTKSYTNHCLRATTVSVLVHAGNTNHCVRATTISVLVHADVANREIMKSTGHKCDASLDSYNADSSNKQKRKYSSRS